MPESNLIVAKGTGIVEIRCNVRVMRRLSRFPGIFDGFGLLTSVWYIERSIDVPFETMIGTVLYGERRYLIS